MISVLSNKQPLNLFAVAWSLITLIVLIVSLAVHFFEHRLPRPLINAYKYGKVQDRSIIYTGETIVECLRDLLRGQIRQVPKR